MNNTKIASDSFMENVRKWSSPLLFSMVVYFLAGIYKDIQEMNESINNLLRKTDVVSTQIQEHEKRIDKIETIVDQWR